ncbi:CHAT domain-containing protein [Streptomyces sparsogenes]|uniref:CHAT domain-containing protein n=1 Tax=Streptomyces sparsogenes TaxID=67365 RepID=UPI0033DEBC2A
MHAKDIAALRERAAQAAAEARTLAEPSPLAEGAPPDSAPPPTPPDPALVDQALSRLEAIEAELAPVSPDGDPLLCTVRARLGGLYAARYRRSPTDADRARGLGLLRAARAAGALDLRDKHFATLHQIQLLLTPAMVIGWNGTLPQLMESFEVGRRISEGDPELTGDLAELGGLLTELSSSVPGMADVPLTWMAETLQRAPEIVRSGDRGMLVDLAERMAKYVPGPGSDVLSALAVMAAEFAEGGTGDRAGDRGGDSAGDRSGDGTGDGDAAGRSEEFSDEEVARISAQIALLLELEVPGTVRPEDLETLVEGVSRGPAGEEAETALRAAMSRMAHGVRTGDADRLAEAAELINDAVDDGGSGRVGWMAGLISPGLLAAANTVGGNLKDRDQARARLDALFSPASSVFDSAHATGPAAAGLRICNQCMHLHLRITEASDERNTEKLEDLLDELLDLLEETGEHSEWQFLVLFLLGVAQLSLAALDGGATALRTAVAYLEEAAGHPRTPTFARPLMDACWAPVLAVSSLVEPDPARVSDAVARARRALDGPASTPDQHVRIRQAIVYALLAIHRTNGERSVLEEAVGELERARRDLTERSSPEVRQKVLWELAEAYRLRDDREHDDRGAAVSAAQESLRVLAEDVLLQLGAEHGLEVARAGASRGLLAAQWAAADGRVAEAVESLEAGRGLVLRAAAAAAGVAEQLAARGEAELAEQWRSAVRDLPAQAAPTAGATSLGGDGATGGPGSGDFGTGGSGSGGSGSGGSGSGGSGSGGLGSGDIGLGAGTPEEIRTALSQVMTAQPTPGLAIPSTLRRRALDALRRPDGGGSAALRGLLAAPGVPALREGLRTVGADALVYLVPGQTTADGAAVLVPRGGEPSTLELPGLGPLGREPLERYLDAGARRSAVPEGDLDAYDEAHRQWEAALEALCDWAGPAVLGPVLDALGARPDGAPVRLVLVPCGNLGAVPWHAARLPAAETGGRRPYTYVCEVAVVSYAASGGEFLRAARRGRMAAGERAVLVADPSGDLMWARDEVAALREAYYPGAQVYGWHEDAPEGALGTPEDVLTHLPDGPAAPPASLLHLVVHGLAGLRPTDSALHLAEGSEGTGRLTVTRILDVPAGSVGEGSAGPLVVLSACETDLSSRDHDEALTPTTALLARGATDVVGSRWKVSDSASAALMVVFHHHLTVSGLAPPDALRAAQLWMLDPDRRSVPGLSGDLLAETEGNVAGLARVVSWAGFIHQGNPAPRGFTLREDNGEIRARAERAAERALPWIPLIRLTPPGADASRRDSTRPGATRDPVIVDRVTAELDAAEDALAGSAPDADPLLCTVRARLGCLYAYRYKRDSADGDRTRGLELLRAARAAGALDPRDEWTATAYHTVLLPMPAMGEWDGTLSRFLEVFESGNRMWASDSELAPEVTELCELLTEWAPTLPARVGEPLLWTARTLQRLPELRAGGMAQMTELTAQLAEQMPGPGAELMLAVTDTIGEFIRSGGGGEDGEAGSATEPIAEGDGMSPADLAFLLESRFPGTIRVADLGALVEAVSQDAGGGEAETAMQAALARWVHAMRTGDPDLLADAADSMSGAAAGAERVNWLAGLLSPGLLGLSSIMGGNLTDRDQALAQLDGLFGSGPATFDSAHAMGAGASLRILCQCMRVLPRITGAVDEQDTEKLEDLLDELLDLLEETGDRGEWHYLVLILLGQVHLALAMLDGGVTALRTGVAYVEEAAGHPSLPGSMRPLLDSLRAAGLGLCSRIEPDPERVLEAVAHARRALDNPAGMPHQQVVARQAIAFALRAVHTSTGDRSVLEEAVGELEQARRSLTERPNPDLMQRVLWELAETYRLRDDRDHDDRGAAVGAARESLRVLAEDVLLQLGAEHGLEVARAGANRGLYAARWAAAYGAVGEAVEALEAGRGLVLRAAAAAAGVPEQLAARGEAGLAEQWRTAVGGLPPHAASGFTIPSALRRRALDVLRRPDDGSEGLRGLLDAPGIAELREGLRTTGADALVYLLPGQGVGGGAAVLVPRTGEPAAMGLPGLDPLGREPLESYFEAGARRSAVSEHDLDAYDEAHRQWEAALEGLCDWAGPAVVGPVLDALGARPDGGPVRLVLVPCGNLGAVPWHAARLPVPLAAAGRPYTYVCEVAVVSYAASGGEFLRAARRGRMVAGERAVLVADPSGDLLWARDEVAALREAYYPGAQVYGWHEEAPEGALGTPEDVLAHLPDGPVAPAASLLHLVVHGLAGLRPTDSALHLAEGADGTGRLTVTRILDVPAGPVGERIKGPLIVLSACETDLSSRDHDEALTPTTALLARGATDVVGSRWKVSDSASAALMVVFHHHLTVSGLAPPDALRAAQLWMLDPERGPVPGLTDELLAETEGNVRGLARVVSWGGFIHQGNPAAQATVAGGRP